jgi:hypothetical protein
MPLDTHAGLAYRPRLGRVVTGVDNVPGTGAALFRKLADAGVDLSIAVPVGMSGYRLQIGIGATDPALLKRVLGVQPSGQSAGGPSGGLSATGSRVRTTTVATIAVPASHPARTSLG